MAYNQNHLKIYIVDLTNEVDEFHAYHAGYSNQLANPVQIHEYVNSMLEQMIAHFEYQDTAVQSFVGHYAGMVVEGESIEYRHHPWRFLRKLSIEECHGYMYCLYGFANSIYQKLESSGLYAENGQLIASWQHFAFNTLYLIERPEAPHAIFS